MAEDNGNRRDPLGLAPPSFQVPDDSTDYELWTIRMPASVDVSALQGMELDVEKLGETFETENGDSYAVVEGDKVENQQFRLLLGDGDFMHPHDKPFDRHVNVIDAALLNETADTEMAPRLENAPNPVDSSVRRSYSHIPQASGLKRRWMPPGAASNVTVPAAATAKVKTKRGTKPKNGLQVGDVDMVQETERCEPSIATREAAEITTCSNRVSIDSSPEEPNSKRFRALNDSTTDGEGARPPKEEKRARKAEKKARKAEKKAKKERKREKDKKRKRSK